MAVVEILGGKVVATFRDVRTVADARSKYPHLKGKRLEVGSYPSGTLFSGGRFTAPDIPSKEPEPESPFLLALRELAVEIGPAAVGKINSRFGSGV